MHYYVYIIESLVDGSFYKGFTLDFNERVKQHNEGWSNYTSRKIRQIGSFRNLCNKSRSFEKWQLKSIRISK
ncbi:MAG: GIY-YIG nuclease family protein [Bacteroidetes bacterium]|nr:GIY-YIG nuclease family protein [Bacteroidota bacterium]